MSHGINSPGVKNMKRIIKQKFIYKSVLVFLAPLFFASAQIPDETGTGRGIITNPLASKTFEQLVLSLSQIITYIGVPIAALFIIYSGLKFVTARGNEDKINDAKNGLLWAIVGTGILIGAWVIVRILESTVKSL